MKYPTLRSSEFRMTYDEYDLQIVTRDVILSCAKCDYKLITLQDSPCAPLQCHWRLLGESNKLLRVCPLLHLTSLAVLVCDRCCRLGALSRVRGG